MSGCETGSPMVMALALLGLATSMVGCPASGTLSPSDPGGVTIVFKHGKLAGGAGTLGDLLREFEARHPGVHVREELLPASTDQQHQFYAMNLEGERTPFDVLAVDVIWVQEFAKAGWIRDLDHLLPTETRERYFPAAVRAATFGAGLHALPWYVDAGVLYYRKDLLARHGFGPPRTWDELVRIARAIREAEGDPRLTGFVWQGKQYEGLVCTALEFIWGHGGALTGNGEAAAVSALAFMRGLIGPGGVSPPLVTTADEEASRHLFGAGRAIFMRNWPYAWDLYQREDSPVRDKVGLAPLPSFPGHDPVAVLGGWMLAVPSRAGHPVQAEWLIRFLVSPEAQRKLALTLGYKPALLPLYEDPSLLGALPELSDLYPALLAARPRPVTPYYLMLSQILQPEFSAALVGAKPPEAALASARRQMDRLLREEAAALEGRL